MSEFETEARTRLDKARKDLDNLVRQREGVDLKIAKMEQVVAGLEYVVEDGNGASGRSPQGGDGDLAFMSRHNAIVKLLKDANGPVSTRELLASLQAVGRHGDTLNGVSGVLSRLGRMRLAQHWGKRGYWIWASNAAGAGDTEEPE